MATKKVIEEEGATNIHALSSLLILRKSHKKEGAIPTKFGNRSMNFQELMAFAGLPGKVSLFLEHFIGTFYGAPSLRWPVTLLAQTAFLLTRMENHADREGGDPDPGNRKGLLAFARTPEKARTENETKTSMPAIGT